MPPICGVNLDLGSAVVAKILARGFMGKPECGVGDDNDGGGGVFGWTALLS